MWGAPRPTDRLSDFQLAGRAGPVAALAVIVAFMYLSAGWSASLELLLELCAAYAVAFLALAFIGMYVAILAFSTLGLDPQVFYDISSQASGH